MKRSFRVSLVLRLAALAALCLCIPACGPSKITKANYDKVATNMTEEEVTAILGPPTERVGVQNGDFGVKQSVWRDGNNTVTVSFLNGRVAGKVSLFMDGNNGNPEMALNADGNKIEFKVNPNGNAGGGFMGNPPQQKQNPNGNAGGGFRPQPEPKPQPGQGNFPGATKANFDRVKTNMTEAEVTAILGQPTKRTAQGFATFLEWSEAGKADYLIQLHLHDGKVAGMFAGPDLK